MTATVALDAAPPATTPAQQLTATVLVPAHADQHTIVRCLRAIQASSYPLERIVVVAYDGPGADDSANLARGCGVEVWTTSDPTKDGKQNLALPTITSDVVVGFDADTFPEPDCIALELAALAGGYDAVGGTVLPAQPKGFFIRARRYAYALGRRWWRWSQSKVGRIQVLTGACYAFRTDALQAIGGFPSVGISADMDVTWALHRGGFRVGYIGRATALTMDPETFAAYRAQMQRWAAGYFQTMAKHKRGLLHPKAMLVVWTALFDLLTLPVSYGLLVWGIIHHHPWVTSYGWFMGGRLAFNTVLVATVVGPREALLGAVPYLLVNFYNKTLYLWTFVREWILGRHYGSWTGRHGHAKVIHPMTRERRAGLATLTAVALTVAALRFAPPPPPPPSPAPPPTVVLPAPPANTIIHPDGHADTQPIDQEGP
jgi:cellulose synthase/poly-beta-1,6-N-acetylglucosamine synthase-like glycosyltransferase